MFPTVCNSSRISTSRSENWLITIWTRWIHATANVDDSLKGETIKEYLLTQNNRHFHSSAGVYFQNQIPADNQLSGCFSFPPSSLWQCRVWLNKSNSLSPSPSKFNFRWRSWSRKLLKERVAGSKMTENDICLMIRVWEYDFLASSKLHCNLYIKCYVWCTYFLKKSRHPAKAERVNDRRNDLYMSEEDYSEGSRYA